MYWEFFISMFDSKINVEKVVKAPINPTNNTSLISSEKEIFPSSNAHNKPTTKHPITFTVIVPTGNSEPESFCIYVVNRYLRRVPTAPAISRKIIFCPKVVSPEYLAGKKQNNRKFIKLYSIDNL